MALARVLDGQKYQIATYDHDRKVCEVFSTMISGIPNIRICESYQESMQGADIVILAVPIDQFDKVLHIAGEYIPLTAILTDIGSVKEASEKLIMSSKPMGLVYVGSHTLSGRDGVGPASADANMLRGATVVVIPQDKKFQSQQKIVESLWQDTGAKILNLDSLQHDRLFGMISHFEHVVAFALTAIGENAPGSLIASPDYLKAGNLMLDTTRIARASVPMWLPIFDFNRANVLQAAQGFDAKLRALETLVARGDRGALINMLRPAYELRMAMEDQRPREHLAGEVYDIAREFGYDLDVQDAADLRNSFNDAALISLAKRTVFPALLSAAITLNAVDMNVTLPAHVSIQTHANTSIKDGTLAMLTQPEYVADLLLSNGPEMEGPIAAFKTEFSTLLQAIQSGDAEGIGSYIRRVYAIRNDMPNPKTAAEMRTDFIVDQSDDQPVAVHA